MAFRNSAIPRLVPGMREGWGKVRGLVSEGIRFRGERGVRELDGAESV